MGGQEGEKPPFLGVYSDFLQNDSNDFVKTLQDVSRLVGATFYNSGIFGKILNPGLVRCEKLKNGRFLSNRPLLSTIFSLNDRKLLKRIFKDFFKFLPALIRGLIKGLSAN